jgi:hypothetical protein
MRRILPNLLALGLVAGLIGLGIYFFGFGQTYEGEIRISAENNEPGSVGLITFQSRFTNRRFLTHSVYLNLFPDTPVTYRGVPLDPWLAAEQFDGQKLDARVGYREEKSGRGETVSLDLAPPGTSPKEVLLISSLLLIFGCTAGMAILANSE